MRLRGTVIIGLRKRRITGNISKVQIQMVLPQLLRACHCNEHCSAFYTLQLKKYSKMQGRFPAINMYFEAHAVTECILLSIFTV